jgi:protein phosphatase
MRSIPAPFPNPLPFRVEVATASDVGRLRDGNEDRVLACDLSSGVALGSGADATANAAPGDWLAAVCDGMGGEAGGEVASRMAVDTILGSMLVMQGSTGDLLMHAVRSAIELASQVVFTKAQGTPALLRMGTTATVAALGDSEIVIGQVGDSRAYLYRRGALLQLTRDQTLAALLAERSNMKETVGSNVILQAVGARPTVDVALTRVPIASGDVLLLCSDGLFGPVDDDVICTTLGAHERPRDACAALIDAANARGGPDNISCIVARFARP